VFDFERTGRAALFSGGGDASIHTGAYKGASQGKKFIEEKKKIL